MPPQSDETVTQRMYIERWQQALRVLENMTPHEREKHFDMRDWGRRTECGTVACLAGHCALDPWFIQRGFSATFRKDYDYTTNEPYMALTFERLDPHVFFGDVGDDRVFLNTEATYDETVASVREHIAYLEAGGRPNEDDEDE